MSLEPLAGSCRVLSDVATKEERVRQFLGRNGIDALVLGRQDNFAWITTGGDNRVVSTTEIGAGTIVIGKDHKWLVSYVMDGRRLVEEQMPGEGYELVTLQWHEGDPAKTILELTEGMEIGADFPLRGARRYGSEIVDLHYPLTDLEITRYRWIGKRVNEILAQVAWELEPGVTERDVAARLLYEYARAGMMVDVLIVGFDDRVRRYRHPMPTGNALQRYALLHVAARRWGLHANVTRLVHFGEPPSETRRAIDGAARIGAQVRASLRPGVRFSDVLAEQQRLYAELGYGDEWKYHFQGGITGYILADPARCLDPEARAVERQAYDYFITITGAKYEECLLLTGGEPEAISIGDGWPTRVLETAKGKTEVADVLIR